MAGAGYLVQYGRTAFLGRFLAGPAERFERGDPVLVRTARGIEAGTVLCEAEARFAGQLASDVLGEIVGRSAADDAVGRAESVEQEEAIRAEAERLAAERELPLLVLDVEILHDGQAVVQVVCWADCDLTALFQQLSADHGRPVKLFNDTHAKAAAGCGKAGCGGGGCSSCGSGSSGGCSTGGCSRGAVRSAADLTAYFADLRRQMEAQAARVPLA